MIIGIRQVSPNNLEPLNHLELEHLPNNVNNHIQRQKKYTCNFYIIPTIFFFCVSCIFLSYSIAFYVYYDSFSEEEIANGHEYCANQLCLTYGCIFTLNGKFKLIMDHCPFPQNTTIPIRLYNIGKNDDLFDETLYENGTLIYLPISYRKQTSECNDKTLYLTKDNWKKKLPSISFGSDAILRMISDHSFLFGRCTSEIMLYEGKHDGKLREFFSLFGIQIFLFLLFVFIICCSIVMINKKYIHNWCEYHAYFSAILVIVDSVIGIYMMEGM